MPASTQASHQKVDICSPSPIHVPEQQALRHHPDKNPNNVEEATAKFKSATWCEWNMMEKHQLLVGIGKYISSYIYIFLFPYIYIFTVCLYYVYMRPWDCPNIIYPNIPQITIGWISPMINCLYLAVVANILLGYHYFGITLMRTVETLGVLGLFHAPKRCDFFWHKGHAGGSRFQTFIRGSMQPYKSNHIACCDSVHGIYFMQHGVWHPLKPS